MVCLPLVEYLPVTDTAAPSTMVSPSTFACAALAARHKPAAVAATASGFSFANMIANLPFIPVLMSWRNLLVAFLQIRGYRLG